MKQSVFNKLNHEVKLRLKILRIMSIFSLRESLAYAFNNYASFLSMVTYMTSYLIFLSVIFGRIKSIAGYTYPEILFFTLIGQISVYMVFSFVTSSIDRLDASVNKGELDLWLVRPVPILWFASIQDIRLMELVFSAIPATIPLLVLLIPHWSELSFTPLGVVSGVYLLLIGHVLVHCFQFIVSFLTFFTGEGKNARNMALEVSFFGDGIPFEAYPNPLKVVFLTVIPNLVHTAISTSFFLGKNHNYWLILYATLLASLFIFLKIKAWNFALRHYSSASS